MVTQYLGFSIMRNDHTGKGTDGMLCGGFGSRSMSSTGNNLLATSRISSPVRKGDVSMMAKNVRLSEKSRQKLVEGINIVANAVKVTLGPKVGGARAWRRTMG